MASNEQEIEQEIQAKGLNAPRLSPKQIDAVIVEEYYWRVPTTCTTVCALVLQNGFTVIGNSSPVSQENFDEDLGKKIARDHAREKVWQLEGYLLRQKLIDFEQIGVDPFCGIS